MRFALLFSAFVLSAQGLPIPQDSGMVESPPLVPESAGLSIPESGQLSALPMPGSESGPMSESETPSPAPEAPTSESPSPESGPYTAP